MIAPLPHYIALDTETGGIPKHTSLLTAYFAILTEDFQLVGDLDLKMKPDDGVYLVEGEALGVNKIDLVSHTAAAMTYKEAATAIYQFLAKHNPGKLKMIPIGHNVAFDIERVCDNTLTKKSWENFVGYRKLDTGTMALDRQATGHLPRDISAGLGSLAKYFDVEFEAHTAKGDTWATIHVCRAMLNLTKKQ
jgi:DNA polymerase III epsilon subunit-like protein